MFGFLKKLYCLYKQGKEYDEKVLSAVKDFKTKMALPEDQLFCVLVEDSFSRESYWVDGIFTSEEADREIVRMEKNESPQNSKELRNRYYKISFKNAVRLRESGGDLEVW